MRIVISRCSAVYTGRGDTTLPAATRAIIIKSDGSVSIHADKNFKPLNYMTGKVTHTETVNDTGETVWLFETRKETLTITLHETISDTAHELEAEEPGLVRDGTERDLQEWIYEHPEILGEGYRMLEREHRTVHGPVDLLAATETHTVAVEVKRVATLDTVGQVLRYINALQEVSPQPVEGIIIALDIRPKTQLLAEKHAIKCVTVPSDWKTTLKT